MNGGTSTTPIETTGRYLILLPEDDVDAGIREVRNCTGISSVARAADYSGHTFTARELDNSDSASVFDSLGVAVVSLDADQVQSVRNAVAGSGPLQAVEAERVVYAIEERTVSGLSTDYLRGYLASIDHLLAQAIATDSQPIRPALSDGTDTWGLQATRVIESRNSGLNVRVAVLDTGFDLAHPDFAGRSITSQSFIEGEEVQDLNGHGTHCIGTACGPQSPSTQPRYGIAYKSEIFAGKVLSNRGSGFDRGILAGIEWAINHNCQVISMSLGAPTRPGDSYSRVYEQVGKRALDNGSLIVAAAGNESDRNRDGLRDAPPSPVGHPANAPSIVAVAAVDSQMRVAPFSNGSINPEGGQIDIAGPGVNVYSSWPMPTRYRSISGTSMATPHVAGIAALYAEATGKTGLELWGLLMKDAQRLSLPCTDVGIGLVQAPL